ncbi:hypothetical protein C8J57DRAFT_624645 [Mycena rebaudengoi]|nr:hypothetical protein C8J57DRAFT_624645 [Mycena rebaudengoi]
MHAHRRTDRVIVETLDKPQVTFSCDGSSAPCASQFWVVEVEAFYCALGQCTATTTVDYESTTTTYACESMQCSCIPGRVMCGLSGGGGGGIDQSEFFQKEIKGPASFSCKTGAGCKFEGPGMDMLVSALYGDDSMTMDCDVGECLRRSQVPGSSLRKVQ